MLIIIDLTTLIFKSYHKTTQLYVISVLGKLRNKLYTFNSAVLKILTALLKHINKNLGRTVTQLIQITYFDDPTQFIN